MIGNSFIPHCPGHHDQMTHGNILFENAAAATGDEFPTAKGNRFFEQTRSDRRAHTGMEKSEALVLIGNFINTMRSIFPFIFHGDLRVMFSNDFVDHLFEKCDNTMLRQIPGAADVYPEQITGAPYLDIRVNREAAARYFSCGVEEIALADGKAIGGACRHAGRAIEDCYVLNKRAERAADGVEHRVE